MRSDLSEFQNFARSLKQPAVDRLYATLREVGNLFVVGAQNIRSLVDERDSALRRLSDQDLFALIRQRADYRSEREKLAKAFPGIDK
jgi:hypothetical protein